LSQLLHHKDQELLCELKKGSKKSFEEIFHRYWPQLYRIAYSKLKSKNEAEEIVQEIFVNLWQGRDHLHILNLEHYLKSAIKFRVISNIRKEISKQKYWDYYKQFIPGYHSATEESVEYDDLDQALEKAILKLPAKSQLVFKLNRIQGLSIEEISNQLNVPRRTIEHHLTQSTRSLRIILKDYTLLVGAIFTDLAGFF
jgi:RNA polymerase sigma-70 factor (ECF subfamily)